MGAGFLMQPSGMDVLGELGICEEVISHASRVKRLHVLEKDGRDLMELRYEEIGEGLFGAGLHRPVVMDALIRLVEKEGVEIRWGSRVESAEKLAEDLLAQIDDWEQVLTARYGDVRMGKWHGDRVVFLGDAGHAMSPQLGQGVNLALEDASCLAACLAEMPLDKALWEYSRRRGPVPARWRGGCAGFSL